MTQAQLKMKKMQALGSMWLHPLLTTLMMALQAMAFLNKKQFSSLTKSHQRALSNEMVDQSTIPVIEDEPPLIETLGHSSRGRQCRMSCIIHDSVEEGLSQNFAWALSANINQKTIDPIVFLCNGYDLKHDAELGMQEQIKHPIAFHAEMMGDIM